MVLRYTGTSLVAPLAISARAWAPTLTSQDPARPFALEGVPVDGTLARTLADATCAASGSTCVGTLARTLGDATSTASGAAGASGTVSRALGSATCSATGATGPGGSVGVQLANCTSVASGASGAAGYVARILAGSTSSASGLHAPPIVGTVTVTLGDSTLFGEGLGVVPTGGASVLLDADTCEAEGTYTKPRYSNGGGGLRRMRSNVSVG